MTDRHPLAGPTEAALAASTEPLILDFLAWLAAGPRPYAEVMEAWRTSCPRLTIWEDASEAGYVVRARNEGGVVIALTARGHAFLAQSRQVAA